MRAKCELLRRSDCCRESQGISTGGRGQRSARPEAYRQISQSLEMKHRAFGEERAKSTRSPATRTRLDRALTAPLSGSGTLLPRSGARCASYFSAVLTDGATGNWPVHAPASDDPAFLRRSLARHHPLK